MLACGENLGQQVDAHAPCGAEGAAGAVIAQRLRAAVAQQLRFTCSAGIGPNKLLAKIGSAKNKPNKQTVVLPRAIDSLMQVRVGVLCAAAAAVRAQRVQLHCGRPYLSTASGRLQLPTQMALCVARMRHPSCSGPNSPVYTHVCLLCW